jgi:hypothetical protein
MSGRSSSPSCLSRSFSASTAEDDGRIAGKNAAETMHQRVPRFIHLTIAALAAQLPYRLHQNEDSEHSGMAVSQASAAGIDWEFRSGADAPIDHLSGIMAQTPQV